MNYWLQRHPLLLAAWLGVRARWMRAPRGSLLLAAAATGSAAWLTASHLRGPAAWLTGLMLDYGVVLAGFVALHAVLVVSRLRRSLQSGYRQSWLVAAPIARRSVLFSIAAQITIVALTHLMALLLFAGLAAWLAAKPAAAADIAVLITAGFVSGAVLGSLLSDRKRDGREASRYAPKLRGSADQWQPSARSLAHLPIAQVFAWHRPENLRIVVVAVLFTVQGGSSMLGGLCVVSAWLLAIYLVTLLQATIHVGRTAARWLRCTPVTFLNFAWPIARQSFLQQVIGAVGSGVLGVVLGSPLALTCYLVVLWIMIVIMVLVVSLADCYRDRRSTAKLALSLAGLTAIELRAQGWSLPVVLLMIGWHVRHALQAEGRRT